MANGNDAASADPASEDRGGRPSDDRLWQAIVEALSEVIEPALQRGHAKATAHQLGGLARYARARGIDPSAGRAAQLAPLVGLDGDADWARVAVAASQRLIAARVAGLLDESTEVVRSLLVDYVAADLEVASPLLETFARHGDATSGEALSPATESAALERWLQTRIDEPITVFRATVMSGGHSRRMLDVTAETANHTLALVARIEQGGVFGTNGGAEARVMQALDAAGVPVAPIRWVETDAEVLGHPFFVMSRVPGTDDPDDEALLEFLDEIDRLHRVPLASVADGFDVRPRDPEEGVTAAIDHWEAVYRSGSAAPIPLLEDAAAWLRRHLRPTGPLAVVHGDPGPGNFLHLGGRVTAVTDWEFAHIGDTAEDWVYLSELRGARLMDRQAWAELLAAQLGIRYDERTWQAWTAYNLFKGACANITALHVFNAGIAVRPNLLAVGTAIQLRFVARLAEVVES